MVKLNQFLDEEKKKLVKKIISENINIQWLREILLQKKFNVGHHSRELSLVEFFDAYIWDNLVEEQRLKVIEALNLIIEEDLFLEREPCSNYWSHLLDFAIMLSKKSPGKINSKPFLIWKEKGYSNLASPLEKVSLEFVNRLNEKIEKSF